MGIASGVLLTVYFCLLGGLALFGIHRLYLSLIFLRGRCQPVPAPPDLPPVTVQLPVYNEIYVLDRLVEAACALDYPESLLQIQILDDSTDGTTARARELAESWRRRGREITCIHRESRDGFKAGALALGTESATGELIAVFDADFVPPPDFLHKAVPLFGEPRVGMVQGRWGHLNREFSTLTRAQALMLDAHFRVEQSARSSTGRFFNFNGTAGIFRKSCIREAGGWQSDTLTEDLDLSYRAQMAGWQFRFLDDLVCPAELPVEMNALRSQQHRWAKGSLQTAFKILPGLLRARLPLRVKVEAVFHLTNNLAYLLLFAASILLVPTLAVRQEMDWHLAPIDLLVFLAGTCSFAFYAAASQKGRQGGLRHALAGVPVAMALGAGLALNNALAVVEAGLGIPSGFRRTPKYRVSDSSPRERRSWLGLEYRGDRTRLAPLELGLALTFSGTMVWAWNAGLYSSIPFLALFGAGYGYVSILTLAQSIGEVIHDRRRRQTAQETA